MTLAVTTYRYRSQRSDEPLRTKLVELAREKPRFGYRRLHVLLRGERVNHKRLRRIYREAGLRIRRKKRKHCVREGKPLVARTSANRPRRSGVRTSDPGAERGRCVHAGVFGVGSGHELCQAESDASAGADRGRTRSTAGDSMRQRAGADEPAFSGVVRGTADRVCCTFSLESRRRTPASRAFTDGCGTFVWP
jgi:hypothetical protein